MTTGTSSRASTTRPGYVRWTERRNLECFLDLLARKDIEVESLVTGVFPVEQATTVYADLASGAVPAVGVLLSYPAPVGRQPGALHQPGVRGAAESRATRHQCRAAGGRVHRRRQLRILDAAAASGADGERPLGARRHRAVAVGRQRPAPLRLHHRLDRRRRRAWR